MTDDQTTDSEITGSEITGLPELVRQSVEHHAAALEPIDVGDFGRVHIVPPGWDVHTYDQRTSELIPRRIDHTQRVLDVDSLATYIEPHTDDPDHTARAYARTPYGAGPAMLVSDSELITVVLDDHKPHNTPDGRSHRCIVVGRPTAAARRWGRSLTDQLTQEQFLSLVVDGVAEIAEPDGAVLRHLVQDLHAIRTTSIEAVQRTGGNGSIVLGENVKLSAGPGDRVEFPEQMRIVLQPFAGVDATMSLVVRIVPTVLNDHVRFQLHAPQLEDELQQVVADVAADVQAATELDLIWTL